VVTLQIDRSCSEFSIHLSILVIVDPFSFFLSVLKDSFFVYLSVPMVPNPFTFSLSVLV